MQLIIDIMDDLRGPLGGVVAIAAAAGAIAGYTFSEKTAVKQARNRIERLEAEIENVRRNSHIEIEELRKETQRWQEAYIQALKEANHHGIDLSQLRTNY